jgi:hypothetical protein
MKRPGWDGATIEQRTFSSGIKDSAADDNRGATAPPTLSSKAHAFKRHRHANVRAFVFGQGRRDDGRAPSTVATATQAKPKAMLTIPFFKLNTLLN